MRRLLVLFAVFSLGACDSSTEPPAPAAVEVIVGDAQEGMIGQALPESLQARVVDAEGEPIPDVRVEWAVVSGSGTIEPSSARTDASGSATATWTLGDEVGTQEVEARVEAGVVASFEARARPHPQVSAGAYHTCATTPAGETYCWGYNTAGQVGSSPTSSCISGEDTYPCNLSPVGLGGPGFVQATAGGFHNCGLSESGAASCWGFNDFGELGDRSRVSSMDPQPVAEGLTFSSVDGGRLSTCGITSDGSTHCWGSNWGGQVGSSSVETGDGAAVDHPVPVAGSVVFEQVSAGGWHTCGVSGGGQAYCWGFQEEGRLGNGVMEASPQPTPVAVQGGLVFAEVTAGLYHTCGVTTSGAAYCWGWNDWGQLGNGSYTDASQPVAVWGGHEFVSIELGAAHTCGLTTQGDAYCWGANGGGQLGTSSAPACGDASSCSQTPLLVSGGHSFRSLSVGYNHVCALDGSFDLYCWGRGNLGQLGLGSTSDSATPMLVNQSFTSGFATSAGLITHAAVGATPPAYGSSVDMGAAPPADRPAR